MENLTENKSELDPAHKFTKIHYRKQNRGLPGQDTQEDNLKKSPSTPNLNWRYAVTEDSIMTVGGGGGGEAVVKRRPKKVQRARPRSEFRERSSEETWIDGQR